MSTKPSHVKKLRRFRHDILEHYSRNWYLRHYSIAVSMAYQPFGFTNRTVSYFRVCLIICCILTKSNLGIVLGVIFNGISFSHAMIAYGFSIWSRPIYSALVERLFYAFIKGVRARMIFNTGSYGYNVYDCKWTSNLGILTYHLWDFG